MADTSEDLETEATNISIMINRQVNAMEHLTQQTYAEMRNKLVESVSSAVHLLAARVDGHHTEVVARRLCNVLFGASAPPDDFWATRTGQNVAWAIGYPKLSAPVLSAAAVLRMTRQNVHKLANESVLTRCDGGIGAESLRMFIRRRALPRIMR